VAEKLKTQDGEASHLDDKKLLEEAQARFKLAEEAESEVRALALSDIEFSLGKQWDPADLQSRKEDGRPCLTINKIPQFIQQVTNDQRQNRPSIKVHPVDDKADPETAKINQGLIRHIEYNSNAEVAYDTAFDSAVRGGFGYWRVITNYADPLSFEQEILIKRVRNPFSVFFDPHSTEPDGSDATFAFITEDISKDEFLSRYPESKLSSKDGWEATGNAAPGWLSEKSARVAEYFYKENRKETIYLLHDGSVVARKDLAAEPEEGAYAEKRETTVPKICWVKISGAEVLERTEWLGSYIPIIPVYGNELDVNGKRILEGVVRNAKDPARMYNFWASAETEAIALAPRAPYIADAKQIEGYEAIWATANKRNHSYLPYNAIVNGVPLPPPQRQSFDASTQAITQARMLAADDLKATTGIYDAALGAKSNETSGVAIQRRNVQAQTSNFHFVDNLTRSLRHTGRILIDLIPKVYDTARTARIIGEDGEQKVVRVNDPEFQDNGNPAHYDLSVGKYDVTVDVGPSFQTKRQEAVASMMEVTKAMPQLMQIAGDLLMKNMDWPGATDLAERLKKTMDPKLFDDGKNGKQQLPPQVQQQMSQMGQMVEQLTAQLHKLQDEKEQKLVEIESKERIEMKKLDVQVEMKLAELGSKEALAKLTHEMNEISQRLSLLHMEAPIEHGEQVTSTPDAGGMAAQATEMESQDPTGGVPPGLPMEGF
jgi:hypothetical protein